MQFNNMCVFFCFWTILLVFYIIYSPFWNDYWLIKKKCIRVISRNCVFFAHSTKCFFWMNYCIEGLFLFHYQNKKKHAGQLKRFCNFDWNSNALPFYCNFRDTNLYVINSVLPHFTDFSLKKNHKLNFLLLIIYWPILSNNNIVLINQRTIEMCRVTLFFSLTSDRYFYL